MSFCLYEEWKFISIIPKDVKPCFYDKTFVNVNEWFVTFKRRWKGEKAEKGIVYIENLILNTEKSIVSSDLITLKNLRDILKSSIVGLTNLVTTYKNDEQLEVSNNYLFLIKKVEILIVKIGNQIEEIRNKTNFFSYVPKIL